MQATVSPVTTDAAEGVNDGGDAIDEPPGTPDDGSTQWMDYAGAGRDQLLSTQKLIFKGEDLAEVKVETFAYSMNHPHMAGRTLDTWLFDGVRTMPPASVHAVV